MGKRKFKLTNISWDIDENDDNLSLPTETEVEISSENTDDLNDDDLCEDLISNYLSDKYEFCVLGYFVSEIK